MGPRRGDVTNVYKQGSEIVNTGGMECTFL